MKKRSYEFNTISIIIAYIIVIILGASEIIKDVVTKEVNFLDFTIYPLIIILGIVTINGVRNKRKEYNEVLEKGIKVPGKIVKPEKEVIPDGDGGETNYYLYVKYVNPKTNKEVIFKTDKLGFNPFKRIKSTSCNVYIYNDRVVAEDFEFTKNRSERIFKTPNAVIPQKEGIVILLAITLLITAVIILVFVVAK